ncbi:hypothetical protein [Streptomyces sp.]|uniref:hypothetical protein n=1 Tax=Streptomyces sp. TaxID=1931 RepID=UPI002F414B3F
MAGTAKEPSGLTALLLRYQDAGPPLTCEPVPHGLLNRGRLITTALGRFFLKQHVARDTADPGLIGLGAFTE